MTKGSSMTPREAMLLEALKLAEPIVAGELDQMLSNYTNKGDIEEIEGRRDYNHTVKVQTALGAIRKAISDFESLDQPKYNIEQLLREGAESAWCDAVIGCSHPDPKRAAVFREHFYDWRRRVNAALDHPEGDEGRCDKRSGE